MEGKNQVGSSSSFTSELFGSKDPSPFSSSGIFESMFPSSSKVLGTDSLPSGVGVKTASETWSPKYETSDGNIKGNENENHSASNKDMSSIYQEQRVQPCHLSSSIYYGGQDVYSHPQNTDNAGLNPLYKKDGGEDDSGSACRGNWWQGVLLRWGNILSMACRILFIVFSFGFILVAYCMQGLFIINSILSIE